MDYEELINKLSKRKDYLEAAEKNRLAFEIAEMIMDLRLKYGITQAELANSVGTKQPSIARIEHGEHVPTIPFLERIANALGTKLIPPRFEILEKAEFEYDQNVVEINYYTNERAVPKEYRDICCSKGESLNFTSVDTGNKLVTYRGTR